MNVTAAARAAGISASGLRWYESMGVLPPAERSENGYRNYTAGDVSRLRLVLTLRRLGLSATEAGRLARETFDGTGSSAELPVALQRQREELARRRADLDWLDGELRDLDATWQATGSHGRNRHRAEPISVLFLCNANSGRSQIGEALLAKIGGDRFRAVSAGGNPSPVSDMAVTVLSEVGIDWRRACSKRVEEVTGPFDYVISLSDSMRETCAALPGLHSTLHWHLPDPARTDGPAEARLAGYRRVRDEVSVRMVPFVELALRTGATQQPASEFKEVFNG